MPQQDKGHAALKKVTTLRLELDDQEKSALLLQSAIDREVAAWWQETNQLNEFGIACLGKTFEQHQVKLANIFRNLEVKIHEKQYLTARVKSLQREAKAKEEGSRCAVTTALRQGDSRLTMRKIEWVKGMPHRRANYILSKTRSIRNLTVKGLEPELDQLMEAHQSDLVKLHAAKVAIRRRIRMALDGELLQRRLVLVDVVRRQHARSEYQERTRVERCMKLEQGLCGWRRHTANDHATTSSMTNPVLGVQTKITLICERVHAELVKLLNARRAQQNRARTLMHLLLGKGQSYVADVRISDHITCISNTAKMCEVNLNETITADTEKLVVVRDSAIDALIHRAEASTFSWEHNEIRLTNTFSSILTASHELATTDLQACCSQWTRRISAMLLELQAFHTKLQALCTAQVTAQLRYDRARSQATGPCESAMHKSKIMKASNTQRNDTYATLLGDLDGEYEAAETAKDATTVNLENIRAVHTSTQEGCSRVHENTLAARNEEVKRSLSTNTEKMAKLELATQIELARYAHLSKLIACYKTGKRTF